MLPAPRSPDGRTIRQDHKTVADRGSTASIMPVTNAIERRFREVRRRTRPMGTFQDKTSMDRILFAVFLHENRNQGLATPFALTQTF
jgi:transposase-like protein